jgi:hypothetical protein
MIVLQSWPLNLFMSQASIDVNITHKKHNFLLHIKLFYKIFLKRFYFFEDKIYWLSIIINILYLRTMLPL